MEINRDCSDLYHYWTPFSEPQLHELEMVLRENEWQY